MAPIEQNLTILQGKTFEAVVKWETEPVVYKAITGITQAAPARITCVGHGVPNGWRVAVVSVKGMTQINAENSPPRSSEYVAATVIDSDTLDLNSVNSALFKPYTSGGYVQYYTPKDLAGYTARMTIKDEIGGTSLLSLTTANSRIALDNTAKTITLTLDAADTEAIDWTTGVYDLELVGSDGSVTALLYGTVSVSEEVTT